MRTLIADIVKKEGEKVELMGWVAVRRDHGKLIFIDLRDRSAMCQVVFIGKDKELYEKASQLRSEWVVKITGQVNKRPEKLVNPNLVTGAYEVLAEGLEILNEATTPPFDLGTDGMDVNEEVRMKYRYIDLRRARLQKNLRLRSKTLAAVDEYLKQNDFVEVETPILGKSTPEGARDYLVPVRTYPGKFYALPQAPQQYKQLLMVGGLERYFQVARCFRDEDTRGDRQPEFTQIDLEMSFVKKEDVLDILEGLMIDVVKKVYPEKHITQVPFPRLSHKEAMEKYGTDKPDLRKDKNDPNELAFSFIVDFPFYEWDEKEKKWDFAHNPFSMPGDGSLPDDKAELGGVRANQYDLALNGFEIVSGGIRNHKPELLKKAFSLLDYEDSVIIDKFGHMLEAMSYGAPPHGGAAFGFDRLMMILLNEPNIREVMAFPKTGDGRDLMMEAPSEVSKEQLRELHLEIKEEKKK
ncbi:aspartate--tRNA ligase [Patescibacteria group bacterium]|nr:aspartate--tRNA ligase [Patescibacteria group bacterium]